jgi:hypothetical protein
MIPRLQHLLIVLACAVLLAACPAQPDDGPDLVATQVAVERAAAATLTAEALANTPAEEASATPTATSLLPTAPPANTATPTSVPPTATPSPVPPTVAPTPTPTQIVAVVFPVDGSDPDGNQALRGSFVQSNSGRNVLLPGIPQSAVTDPMIFRERLPVRVEVFEDTVGVQDGDGVAAVEFTVNDPNGNLVLQIREETAPYCLWGGNDLACPAPTFAELGYRWPQTNAPIENGSYSATILITAADNTSTTWFWSFEIDHGGGEALDPVELVLRPACGDTLTAPANAPIDLIYGIWASRGYDIAAANQPYVQIELTVDGQSISGDRVATPVADLPQAICGSDYENSYWVYETVRLEPLSAGAHEVRITYRFSQPIEDGYGGTHSQPFTQQYVINVGD